MIYFLNSHLDQTLFISLKEIYPQMISKTFFLLRKLKRLSPRRSIFIFKIYTTALSIPVMNVVLQGLIACSFDQILCFVIF